jgi:hypothetical protein
MLRAGTNWSDRKAIKEYVDAGVTDAKRIAQNLGVVAAPVQGYIDFLTKPPEPEACEEVVVETAVVEEEPEPEPTPAPAPRRKKRVTEDES